MGPATFLGWQVKPSHRSTRGRDTADWCLVLLVWVDLSARGLHDGKLQGGLEEFDGHAGYAQMASLVVTWMQDLDEVEPPLNGPRQPLDEAFFLRVFPLLRSESRLPLTNPKIISQHSSKDFFKGIQSLHTQSSLKKLLPTVRESDQLVLSNFWNSIRAFSSSARFQNLELCIKAKNKQASCI